MAEYIDRTRLLALAQRDAAIIAPCEHTAEDIIDMIRASPAADVEPVVHAHWIMDDDHKCALPWAKCSACGESCLADADGDPVLSDRCPNCGAHMDGEVTESD